MSRTTLRPCLKHRADLRIDPPAPTNGPLPYALCTSVLPPRVHFPPSPGLCQTHLTHSAAIYDRAPIVVLPNACAMPERNGRTYTPPPNEACAARKRRSTRAVAQGATLHPQAFAAAAAPVPPAASVSDPTGRMPSLVPDLSSSESDESDISPPPSGPTHFPSMVHHHYHHHPSISIVVDGTADPATALAFLPHANERGKPPRERSRSKTRGAFLVRKSEFALPELDGCLGGF